MCCLTDKKHNRMYPTTSFMQSPTKLLMQSFRNPNNFSITLLWLYVPIKSIQLKCLLTCCWVDRSSDWLSCGNWRCWHGYSLHWCICNCRWRCIKPQLGSHLAGGGRRRGLSHRRTKVEAVRRQRRLIYSYTSSLAASKTFGWLWKQGSGRRNASKWRWLLWELSVIFRFCQIKRLTTTKQWKCRRLCGRSKCWSDLSLRWESRLKWHDGLRLLGEISHCSGLWGWTGWLAWDGLRLGGWSRCEWSRQWNTCWRQRNRRQCRLGACQIQHCRTGT